MKTECISNGARSTYRPYTESKEANDGEQNTTPITLREQFGWKIIPLRHTNLEVTKSAPHLDLSDASPRRRPASYATRSASETWREKITYIGPGPISAPFALGTSFRCPCHSGGRRQRALFRHVHVDPPAHDRATRRFPTFFWRQHAASTGTLALEGERRRK